jgi:hypothetical protein
MEEYGYCTCPFGSAEVRPAEAVAFPVALTRWTLGEAALTAALLGSR